MIALYYYKSPIGPMYIKYDQSKGNYLLIINGIDYGHYQSPDAAADDVFCHSTGCFEWDKLDGSMIDVPTSIAEWDKA